MPQLLQDHHHLRHSSRASLGLVPGLAAILLIMGLRFLGVLQSLEWKGLDLLMRLRPVEVQDERITIVAIDEADIQLVGDYPIPDAHLAELLRVIASYKPQVVGIDIFRDRSMKAGHEQLVKILKKTPNLVGIERILPPVVAGPPALPQEQIGFVDALPDGDGFIRRSLLGSANVQQNYRLSFTIQVAQRYLASKGIDLENGQWDPEAMRFGAIELHRFHPNTGGYVRADAGGNQVLLNVRSGSHPFPVVSLRQVLAGQVDARSLQDRIVLVGMVAPSVKDFVNSGSVQGVNPGLLTGIEFQAHAISQVVSAVLDRRPLLFSWAEGWEYGVIALGGLLGLGLGRWARSPLQHLGASGLGLLGLFGLGYTALLIGGLWLPIVPVGLAFGINSTVLYGFYLYDQGIRAQIRGRQEIIDQSFNAIHNGPLQSLAIVRRSLSDQDFSTQTLAEELETIDRSLREIYEAIRQETVSQGANLYLQGNVVEVSDIPLDELLEEVYNSTLRRSLPHFEGIKIKVKPSMGILANQPLSVLQKRGIAQFFEEALCNVGKHAAGATRLIVVCKQENGDNLIQVIDNGVGLSLDSLRANAKRMGGTHQAHRLAWQLGGRFQRIPMDPKGTCCELRWPIRPSIWVQLGRFLSGE